MDAKLYLSADGYLLDAFRLARRILDSGWLPEALVALWRGGAPVGVAVHEFLLYHGVRARHHVLKCGSYTGIGSQAAEVAFENAEALFAAVRPGRRLLVVDDIFDSGLTMRTVRARLAAAGADVKTATVYWKTAAGAAGPGTAGPGPAAGPAAAGGPDFFVRRTDRWVVFPHEMEGLTPEEISLKDPALRALLKPRGAGE